MRLTVLAFSASLSYLLLAPLTAQAGYNYVRSITPIGTQAGVTGLAVDSTGSNLYMSLDAYPDEYRVVEKFTTQGTFVQDLVQGEALSDVAVGPSGNVFTSDNFGGGIVQVTSTGQYVGFFFSDLFDGQGAISIAVDGLGSIWGAGSGIIRHFSNTGQQLDEIPLPITDHPGVGFEAIPTGIAVYTDPFGDFSLMYVSLAEQLLNGPTEGNRILVYGFEHSFPEFGIFPVDEFGITGSGNGQFQFGYGSSIAVDQTNRLFVADSGNNRIQVFDGWTGQYLEQFGTFGDGNGQLNRPGSIAVDPSGNNVWVSDFNFRVQQFQVVPEPSTMALFAIAAPFAFAYRRRRGRKRSR